MTNKEKYKKKLKEINLKIQELLLKQKPPVWGNKNVAQTIVDLDHLKSEGITDEEIVIWRANLKESSLNLLNKIFRNRKYLEGKRDD